MGLIVFRVGDWFVTVSESESDLIVLRVGMRLIVLRV